jgi:hypothetical protein
MVGQCLLHNGQLQSMRVRRCDRFVTRLRGQHFAPMASRVDAWCLSPCAGVHTLFLSRSIDVAFCAGDGRVLLLLAPLHPWRGASCRGASTAWEFPAGTIFRLGLQPGDRLAVGVDP